MKIATAAYPLDPLPSFEAYAEKIESWVATAEADLLIFPEYAAMELAYIVGGAADLQQSIDAVTEIMPDALRLHSELAARYGVHILSGSGPMRRAGKAVNAARLFAPSGAGIAQEKQIMTRFEREEWGIGPGSPLSVADTGLGSLGTLICYDAEFPLLARSLTEAGAEILLVPSCTDSAHGYNRVRVGAMARALESQCISVQAVTVGDAPWCPAVDENHGAAAVYGPPDADFPATGVIAQGAMNVPGWTRAEVDRAEIARARTEGQQFNDRHWSEQYKQLSDVRKVALR